MSRQEGGWCVRRCVFLLKRMTRRLRRESGAYHFNGPLVNLLRQATQRGAGDEWKATCLCRCTPTLPEGNPLRGIDAPTTARTVGLPPRRGKYFLSKRKKVPKKASGTATPEAAHVASHCGQALRYACAWLRASWPSAISGASRPSASLGRGLRPAVAERLDDPNKFGSSNSGLRAGTV